MNYPRIEIKKVIPGSIAEDAGIEKGDVLLSVNGEKIIDIFDYRYQITNEFLDVEIMKNCGDILEIEIEKDEYEDLGIEFVNPLMDEERSCRNKCIFCFIDQLPKGMRQTLYFKDDDSRLSFLTGNYVTLTNMDMGDIQRIIKYRMSPINVSVHATEPELRVKMLRNKFAGDVLDKIKCLTDAGISVNCQIVLCRGINDGDNLDRTIHDLSSLYPGIQSISAVPVGITRHRSGLFVLTPYDAESSKDIIERVSLWQKRMMSANGSRVVYLADEFYIMAGVDLPPYEEYEDFPQLENGVGVIALMKKEFYDVLNAEKYKASLPRSVSIATGVSSKKFIDEVSKSLMSSYTGIEINVYEIKNVFFGENVTVTGLLTGEDILSQLKGRELGDELLISRSMLKKGEEVFLDDFTVDMLSKALDINVTVVDNDGRDFILKVLGI